MYEFFNHPVIAIVLFGAFVFGITYFGKRFRHVPNEDHDPSKHHHWGPLVVCIGLLALSILLVLGYGDVSAAN